MNVKKSGKPSHLISPASTDRGIIDVEWVQRFVYGCSTLNTIEWSVMESDEVNRPIT
jgi:hypothetical protein